MGEKTRATKIAARALSRLPRQKQGRMNSGGFNRRGYLMRRTPIKRYTPLSQVSKDPDRRKRLQATRDVQYGRVRDAKGAIVSDYGAWVRARGCAIRNAYPTESRTGDVWWRCYGRIEFMHLDSRGHEPGKSGIGNGIGGCRWHHRRQHAIGWRRWNAFYGLSGAGIARVNARAYRREAAAARQESKHT